MARPVATICIGLSLLLISVPSRAQINSIQAGRGHVCALLGYSMFADVYQYIHDMGVEDVDLSPFGPLVLAWASPSDSNRLIVGGRLHMLISRGGVGMSFAASLGLIVFRRPWIELTFMPSVGFFRASSGSKLAAWTGGDSSPLFSLGFAMILPLYRRLETVLFGSVDVLPELPIPSMKIGFDAVLGIGFAYRL